MVLLIRGRVSLSFRPNMVSAGDSLVMGSGVLRFMSNAQMNLSVSSFPSEPMLFLRSRLVDLTANSARLLDWGL